MLRHARRPATRLALAARLALVAAALGCARSAARVPVLADQASRNALAGEWAGEYTSAAIGRSGSIVFTLQPGPDGGATGDVVMVPPDAGGAAPASGGTSDRSAARSQVLAIEFVRATGDSVAGTLAPYTAPDCACTLTTRFYGQLRGDTIAGAFQTSGGPGGVRQGRWMVTRRQ